MPRTTTGISKFDIDSDYYVVCYIGEGGNGKCYCLAKEENGKEQFFVLKVSEREINDGEMMQNVNVPLGLKCFEYGSEDEYNWVLMDYIPGLTLSDILELRGYGLHLKKEYFFQIILYLANSLVKLHEQSFYHRDFKPDNIMIDSDMQPHIIDWGEANQKQTSIGRITAGSHGTVVYTAPEAIGQGKKLVNNKTDVFSFGCTLMQMITNRFPFQDLYFNSEYVRSFEQKILEDSRFTPNQREQLLEMLDYLADAIDDGYDYDNVTYCAGDILKIIIPVGYIDDTYKTFHFDDTEQYKYKLVPIIDQCLRYNMNERPNMDEVLSQILEILDEDEKENVLCALPMLDETIGKTYGDKDNVINAIKSGFANPTLYEINNIYYDLEFGELEKTEYFEKCLNM